MVKELSADEQGGSFILGDEGRFILRGSLDSPQPTDFESALKQEVASRGTESDAFFVHMEKK